MVLSSERCTISRWYVIACAHGCPKLVSQQLGTIYMGYIVLSVNQLSCVRILVWSTVLCFRPCFQLGTPVSNLASGVRMIYSHLCSTRLQQDGVRTGQHPLCPFNSCYFTFIVFFLLGPFLGHAELPAYLQIFRRTAYPFSTFLVICFSYFWFVFWLVAFCQRYHLLKFSSMSASCRLQICNRLLPCKLQRCRSGL